MTTTSSPPTSTTSAAIRTRLVWGSAGLTIAAVWILMMSTPRFWRDLMSFLGGANAVLVALIVALPVLDDSRARRLVQLWSARSEEVGDAWRRNPGLAAIVVGLNMGLFGHTVASHVPWVADLELACDWWAWLAGAGAVALTLPLLELKQSPTVKWKWLALCLLLAAIALLALQPAWLSF